MQVGTKMIKVLAIVGPTAVGKSDFGIEVAKKINGEIISGDSIQIYKGLNIGSAKVTSSEMQGIKHYLIDIKNPDENYSVKEFQDLSRKYIKHISGENKLPIIVGGTGLYIKACLYDYEFNNEETKDEEYIELTNEEIYNKLKNIDERIVEKIHINNRKRLVRALNIYEKNNKSIAQIKESQEHKPIFDVKIIGLTKDRQEIYSQCDKRIDLMIKKGLLNEIEGLLDDGVTFDNQCMSGIGYKEFKGYFEGNKSLEECISDVKRNTRHFVKRQYTWFNNQLNVSWHENKDEALKEILDWYEK